MTRGIGRRRFISALGGAAIMWPLAARAQQAGMRRVAVLIAYLQGDQEGQARFAAFVDTLQRLGWSNGRNLRLDVQWVGGDIAGFKAVATELIARSPPDVIVMNGALPLAALLPLTKNTFRSYSFKYPIRSAAGLSATSRTLAATSLVSRISSPRWAASGWRSAQGGCPKHDTGRSPAEIKSYAEFLHTIEALAPTLACRWFRSLLDDATEIERGIAAVAAQPDGGLIVVSAACLRAEPRLNHRVGRAL